MFFFKFDTDRSAHYSMFLTFLLIRSVSYLMFLTLILTVVSPNVKETNTILGTIRSVSKLRILISPVP